MRCPSESLHLRHRWPIGRFRPDHGAELASAEVSISGRPQNRPMSVGPLRAGVEDGPVAPQRSDELVAGPDQSLGLGDGDDPLGGY